MGSWTRVEIGALCACLVFAGLAGCRSRPQPLTGDARSSADRATGAEGAGSGSADRPATPPDAPGVPSPTKIRVLNDTDEPLTFSTTFGPHEPFGLSRLDGPLAPFPSLGGCWCECGGPPCPSAARPETQLVTLQPGESLEHSWPGRLERHDHHPQTGPCCVRFDPPVGRYLLAACTDGFRCGRTEVSLPTSETVTVPMSARAAAESCAAVNLQAAGRVAGQLRDGLGSMLADRPVGSCPTTPRCVEPGDLETELAAARGRPCSLFVVPRGHEVELRVFLPLPRTHVGGECYSHFVDPDFTRVFRVRYEQ